MLFWKMEIESGYAPNLPKTIHRNGISHKAGKQQVCQALVFICQINMFVNQETQLQINDFRYVNSEIFRNFEFKLAK